jgi:hypothetical protein
MSELAIRDEYRAKVLRLESEMSSSGLPIVPEAFQPKHYFAHGVYVRELYRPAGTLIVGKIHKYSLITIILYGTIDILTENGPKRFVGPCIFETPAGIKRATYAHTNALLCTVHGTNETDLDLVEEDLIAKTFEEFDSLPPEAINPLKLLMGSTS